MKIASFNVQKFGRSKVSDAEVVGILVKIIRRYDIIVILEVVDISGTSVKTLLDALNTPDATHRYTMKLSSRLGRSSYKEQFLFLYRDDLVDLVGSYQFDDQETDGSDVFARDPYILRFRCHRTVLKDLVMIPVHTKPQDSETELDELFDVFEHVKNKWRTDNVMILGDFNADGAYVSDRKLQGIRIRADKNFHWLIGDDVDTTASTGNAHTYDRIVVYGDDMLRAVVPRSARPFNFQKAFDLSDEQMCIRNSLAFFCKQRAGHIESGTESLRHVSIPCRELKATRGDVDLAPVCFAGTEGERPLPGGGGAQVPRQPATRKPRRA
ncbi:deoxyribonuclease 1 like 4, tandem duplicate 1 isoform X4 [Syngnathoides biaculeatus]|uniref:deoxyribonuclease 1 like 4, tandem duplicate 1 isoform X4 n=1 Tax=Syngnathoides biaculeatus TaxID=300417 RepID=UPI002ADD9EE6|nr:deoxyribonuclease 1 like 4, tandem duplicate 1 isoform X4 [Syngnathoides biaculeatus]